MKVIVISNGWSSFFASSDSDCELMPDSYIQSESLEGIKKGPNLTNYWEQLSLSRRVLTFFLLVIKRFCVPVYVMFQCVLRCGTSCHSHVRALNSMLSRVEFPLASAEP